MAPILILLAMAAWDGGAVLREQVVLQQAARDGARVAAMVYGQDGVSGVPLATIDATVKASAADLAGLSATPGYLAVTYPTSPAQAVKVTLQYDHALYTPVLRRLWGGANGVVTLQASAVFLVPQLTQTPAAIVPSTPLPTPTPTLVPTVTPTPTRTLVPTITPVPPTPTRTPLPTLTPVPPTPTRTLVPTATLTPTSVPTATPTPAPCIVVVPVPDLDKKTGMYVVVQTAGPGAIDGLWIVNNNAGIDMSVYPGNPFLGHPNPDASPPPTTPVPLDENASSQFVFVNAGTQASGTYTFYFYNPSSGQNVGAASTAVISYVKATCP